VIHLKGHGSLAEMINGHIAPLRRALLCVLGVAANDNDGDNVSYYKHEIAALDDIEHAVSVELVADVARLEGLRALRLHHWKGVLYYSERIRYFEKKVNFGTSERRTPKLLAAYENAKKCHSFQMKQVQFLNDFFPIGDTAERDNNNATNL